MPLPGSAQERPTVVLRVAAQKEVVLTDQNGKSRIAWVEARTLEPGAVLRYVISYKNEGKREARNIVIVGPIPAGTAYIAQSAEGKNAEISFSLDGRTFQSPPLLRYRVKGPAVPDVELSATPNMYTHIKWKLDKPTPPGGSGTVSFKVKVT